MFTVKVNRDKLLDTLQKNREKHVAIFNEARDNYRIVVVSTLRKRASEIEAGEKIDTYFNLPVPTSYEKDYARAIQMVTWAENDTIELDEEDFQNYVNDEWHWKQSFASTTSNYR